MKDDNSLVFSHEQDVDGLFSAAVLKMAFPQAGVVLTNYGFEKMIAIKDKILSFIQQEKPAGNTPGMIVIADIGVNEESYLPVYEALAASKQKGFTNVWVDHHVWSEGMKEKLSAVCELVFFSSAKEKGALDGQRMRKNALPSSASSALEWQAPIQGRWAPLPTGQTFPTLRDSLYLL